jgi:hypothetical protein
MPLVYHQAAFDVMGKTPKPSKKALGILEGRERALGFALPASLREFYSLAGASDVLTDHSNQDPAVPIEELGEPEDLKQGVLRIQDENQGCASWYVRLDGSDDPPVEVASEFEYRDPPEGSDDWGFWDVARFVRFSDRFSDYVHQRVLSYGGDKRDRRVAAKLKSYGVEPTFDGSGRAVSLFFHKERHDRPGFEPALPLDEAGMKLIRRLDRVAQLEVYRPASQMGGWSALRDHPGIVRLRLAGGLEDPAVEHVLAMPALADLSVTTWALTDAGLGRLLEGRRFASLEVAVEDEVTPAGLAALDRQVDLTSLRLCDLTARVGDDDLRHLSGLTRLESLWLTLDRLTDAGLVHLAALSNLTEIRFGRTESLTGEGLRHLSGLVGLRELDLRHRPVTDGALRHLAGLASLEVLDITGSKVEGPGLAWLSGLRSLRRLDCGACPIGDEWASRLGALASLERLDLGGSRVTDGGLRGLSALQSLGSLDLTGCAVSAAAIRDLKSAIPGLEYVTWTPPGKDPTIGRQFDFRARPGQE